MADETKTSLMMKFDQGKRLRRGRVPARGISDGRPAGDQRLHIVLVKPSTIVSSSRLQACRTRISCFPRYFLIKSFGFSAALSVASHARRAPAHRIEGRPTRRQSGRRRQECGASAHGRPAPAWPRAAGPRSTRRPQATAAPRRLRRRSLRELAKRYRQQLEQGRRLRQPHR